MAKIVLDKSQQGREEDGAKAGGNKAKALSELATQRKFTGKTNTHHHDQTVFAGRRGADPR